MSAVGVVRRSFWRDLSLAAATAGFVTVLVGVTSSIAIIFQAAQALGATPGQLASWMLALGLGMGIPGVALSLRYRQPVGIAWSTPGAALIAVSSGYTLAQATGAFIFCGALIVLFGVTRWFERLIDRIPLAIATALLAGVLTRFALDGFLAAKTEPVLVIAMFVAYLLGRFLLPRYAVMIVLIVGVAIAAAQGTINLAVLEWGVAQPEWVTPEWSLAALIGLGVPLWLVTMASQNLPGVAAIRANGYDTPISPLITWTGIATMLLAPFGGYALNLSAITAAICLGPEADPDRERRYTAAVVAGALYAALGLAGAALAAILIAFPKPLVAAIAGLALLGTIGASLAGALKEEAHRDAALITFLVTLSGVSFVGIGSAFWGVAAGGLAMVIRR